MNVPTRLGLLGAALTLMAACSAPANESFDLTREALFANDKAAYDFFIGKGLPNFQAAAVVGNLDQESGVNPTISQTGGGPGRGIAQWSAGGRWDTTPGDNLVAYAAMQGMPTSSLTVQLGFVWYELQTFPDFGLAMFRATTNITDATQVFEDEYEGCVYANFPVCNLPQRVTYAKGILAAYGSEPPPRDGGAGDGAATPDAKAADGAASVDAKTTDGAAPADRAIADDSASPIDVATQDATTSDTTTNVPVPEAAPPVTHDAEPPSTTLDAASTSDAAEVPPNPPSVDESSGCAMPSRGAEGSRHGFWLVAIGLVLAHARRRRRAT